MTTEADTTRKKVAILGGGVGGMSAAHMLINRGFDVEVYERHAIPGGKARSYGVAGTGKNGRHNLPAEHGFRFVPAYYKHLPATMAEIPYWDSGKTVEDQLTQVQHESFTRFTAAPLILPAKMPTDLVGFLHLRRQIGHLAPQIPKREALHYARKIWQLFASCQERRDFEYEQVTWWDFVGASNRSQAYQDYLANMSRTLVAADPHYVSTRTNGNSWLQIILGMWSPKADRILQGPTNEMWIYPWLKYLLDQGVRYYVNTEAVEWICENDRIAGVRIEPFQSNPAYSGPEGMVEVLDCDRYGITSTRPADITTVTADEYISAMPVERMAQTLTLEPKPGDPYAVNWAPVANMDPGLKDIGELATDVQWMNGIQFYLRPTPGRSEAPNQMGHSINADSPFSLTAIFQGHYWPDIDLSRYGDGSVTNVLSVDISDWSTGLGRIYHKPAKELTRTEIKNEVWEDLKTSLRDATRAHLSDENLVDWYLDFDIAADPDLAARNGEPLLVNRVNTQRLRPEAATAIDNLYLASDYVKTYTDLATMEGANEAARRAVNAILSKTGSDAPRCEIWPLEEPEIFKPFKEYDLQRFRQGIPWSNGFPLRMKLKLGWFFFRQLLGFGK
ncbi:MAG: FAD-dependent oxidoreductase [bacterium]